MKKITPFLWFDEPIEIVIKYYRSIFKDAKVVKVRRANKTVKTAILRLHGQDLMLLNGGPHFKFTPAVSFFVNCRTQAEVDDLWRKLSKDGHESRCGWLQDKYGLSWQIIPDVLMKYLADKNPTRAERVWQAMLKMSKIDIRALKEAYLGGTLKR